MQQRLCPWHCRRGIVTASTHLRYAACDIAQRLCPCALSLRKSRRHHDPYGTHWATMPDDFAQGIVAGAMSPSTCRDLVFLAKGTDTSQMDLALELDVVKE
ncbi:hypothetical protein L6452_13679 [Arctium lappa]|uniref:Uncharacterized protein n=1 Tax=Arctium lappa TaxID=4217 RepID=A0ACB9CIW7_ARCLA|nr:hypothetical protein L6452_13679 [Arctium lappa]